MLNLAVVSPGVVMDLDFHPGLPLEVRLDLTEAARGAGMPLWQLELLGQDEATATAFVEAVRHGRTGEFLADMEWDVLEARYQARRQGEGDRFWKRPHMTPPFPEILPITLLLGAALPFRAGRN